MNISVELLCTSAPPPPYMDQTKCFSWAGLQFLQRVSLNPRERHRPTKNDTG